MSNFFQVYRDTRLNHYVRMQFPVNKLIIKCITGNIFLMIFSQTRNDCLCNSVCFIFNLKIWPTKNCTTWFIENEIFNVKVWVEGKRIVIDCTFEGREIDLHFLHELVPFEIWKCKKDNVVRSIIVIQITF